MLKMPVCTGLLLFFPVCVAQADTCPAPVEIRERKISQNYDWSVEENTTLQDLMTVRQLYSVRIMGNGAHISCRYTTAKWPVRLDGDPLDSKCKINTEAGEWKGTETGELSCREKDVTQCGFKLDCKK